VNGHEILRRELEAEKKKLLPWASYHGSVDEKKQTALRRKALQTLIREQLAYEDALRRKLEVDGHELERELQRVIGKYGDEQAFRERLESAGVSEQEVRDAIARRLLVASVEKLATDAERRVSDEEVRRYYEEKKAALVMPRQAKAQRIRIALDPLERDAEDWQAAVARAEAMRQRFAAGEPFEKLADEGEVAQEPGDAAGGPAKSPVKGLPAAFEDLGDVHPGRLDEKLDAALWKLAPGEISQPIRTFKGVHLLLVESFVEQRQLPLDEIAERLHKVLAKRNGEQRLEQWRRHLREQAKIEILDPALGPEAETKPQIDPQTKAESPARSEAQGE